MPHSYLLATYLHLARAAGLRRRPLVRDKLLLLAASVAAASDLAPVAEACRAEILRHNPHHLLKRWPSFAAAAADEEFETFVNQLRRHYPPERAEQLLDSLQVDPARERETYFHDGEYAAALLGRTWDDLQREFGRGNS